VHPKSELLLVRSIAIDQLHLKSQSCSYHKPI
jgi:hypothetical protein